MKHPFKISVITVVFQAGALIDRTLLSVNKQENRNEIQLVIVDGGSTDDTVDKARLFMNEKDIMISEPDEGIYDAMNKGLKLSAGEYVIFINAGDELYDCTTLSRMLLSSEDAEVYYGETAVVDDDGLIRGSRRLTPPSKLTWRSLQYGMCVSHQSILAKRDLCPQYQLKYKISSDIDWTIRLLKNCGNAFYYPDYVSKFLEGGVSSKRRLKGLSERWEILNEHFGTSLNIMNHCWIIVRFITHLITKKQWL